MKIVKTFVQCDVCVGLEDSPNPEPADEYQNIEIPSLGLVIDLCERHYKEYLEPLALMGQKSYPFTCAMCGQDILSRAGLALHVKAKHEMTLADYDQQF